MPDRRRDPRVTPAGRVRVTSGRPRTPLRGRLLDVGAGGLRFSCEGDCPGRGTNVRLEILLEDPACPTGPPQAVLDGHGRIVWVEMHGDTETHAGVSFDAPVDVRRTFPDVHVY